MINLFIETTTVILEIINIAGNFLSNKALEAIIGIQKYNDKPALNKEISQTIQDISLIILGVIIAFISGLVY